MAGLPAKVEYLDGLRGIAALTVVFHHFRELFLPGSAMAPPAPWMELFERSPLGLIFAGRLAVLIFFVHSGFVLSWKYLHTRDDRLLVSMAIRRVPRLGLPIAVSVLFSYCLFASGAMHHQDAPSLFGSDETFRAHFTKYPPPLVDALKDALGGALFYGSIRFNEPLWTMSIELACSYAVFISLPFLVRLPFEAWVVAFGLLVPSLVDVSPWFLCFAAGMLLAHARTEGPSVRLAILLDLLPRRVLKALALTLAILLAHYPSWTARHLPIPAELNPKMLCEVGAASLIVCLVFWSSRSRRFLQRPSVRLLGKLSFPLYLLHFPILCSFSIWAFGRMGTAGVPALLGTALTFLGTMVLVLVASWVMSRYVDQPAINLGKAFLQRWLYRSA